MSNYDNNSNSSASYAINSNNLRASRADNQEEQNSNFHVCVRIRPTSSPSYENQGHSDQQKYIREGPENSILFVQPHSTQDDKVFIYDEVFDSKCRTKDIFDKVVRPNLANSLFNGFSHTVLVYGMTGSGKTFTMFGDNNGSETTSSSNAAVINLNLLDKPPPPIVKSSMRESSSTESSEADGPLRRAADEASTSLAGVEQDSKSGLVSETVKFVLSQTNSNNSGSEKSKTKIKMSYLEIYNEQIRDLLSNESSNSDNLMILEDPDKGVYCPLLIEREISTLEQISQLIKLGNKRRVMASTKLNEFSSRSHAIIQLSLEIEIETNEKMSTYLTPKLYLVDLAGSERASATESKGVRLKEGANINKSLLSLGNCITVLSSADKKKRHVPYRDSKLTRLLKESLGGNAKTLLIACVTPAFRFVEETINTLKYAQRAKSIHKDVYENIKQIYNKIEKNEQQLQQSEDVFSEVETLQGLLSLQSPLSKEREEVALMSQAEAIVGELEKGLSEEELSTRLSKISASPPTTQQVVRSDQFQYHKDKFRAQFMSLSDHFEDILYRSRELECNLAEFVQSKEQNEKLIHEIMDTINPTSLTQKEMKYRLDKVNMLRGVVKNNEDVIVKLQKELAQNNDMKVTIKSQLESLFEVKFIKDCQELSNFQLYNAFELEKTQLQQRIDSLLAEKQNLRDIEALKEEQIMRLRDEIEYMKRKVHENEMLLQQHAIVAANATKSKSRGRKSGNATNNALNGGSNKNAGNLRSSALVQGQKTPRNVSQNNTNMSNVPSKYMHFQTFVPSSNISVNSVRNKSANLRASMYTITSANSSSRLTDQLTSQTQYPSSNLNTEGGNRISQQEFSPTAHTREFEEYKRKESIIESQLKNMNKNSSQKSVKNSYESTAAAAATTMTNNFWQSNRHQNHFKTTYIDQPTSMNQADNHSQNIGSNVLFASSDNYSELMKAKGLMSSFDNKQVLTRHANNDQGHMTFGEMFQSKGVNSSIGSPKSKGYQQPLRGSSLIPSTQNQQQQQQSQQSQSKHVKNPSFSNQDSKYATQNATTEFISSTPAGLAFKLQPAVVACQPIPESLHEQSVLMSVSGGPDERSPKNNVYPQSLVLPQPQKVNSSYKQGVLGYSNSIRMSQDKRNISPFSVNKAFKNQTYYSGEDRQEQSLKQPQQLSATINNDNSTIKVPAKIQNPSFNSYMQNKETYAVQPMMVQSQTEQQVAVAPFMPSGFQSRIVQVPTTAISLSFRSK